MLTPKYQNFMTKEASVLMFPYAVLSRKSEVKFDAAKFTQLWLKEDCRKFHRNYELGSNTQ